MLRGEKKSIPIVLVVVWSGVKLQVKITIIEKKQQNYAKK